MQKLLLILQLLPLLLLLYLSDKDVLGALIQLMWCSGEMVKLSSLGHLHPIYYINSGLLLQRKHLIFHFLLKELDLWSSPTGAFSFTSTVCHIKKCCFMSSALSFIQPLVWQLHGCLCRKNKLQSNFRDIWIAFLCNEEILTTGPHTFSQSNKKYTRNQPRSDKCSTKKSVLGTKFRKSELSKSNHHGDWFIYV